MKGSYVGKRLWRDWKLNMAKRSKERRKRKEATSIKLRCHSLILAMRKFTQKIEFD